MPRGKKGGPKAAGGPRRPRGGARRRAPVLGNDPFELGAAPREARAAAPIHHEPPNVPASPAAEATPPTSPVAPGKAGLQLITEALDGAERRLAELAARAGVPEAGAEIREAAERLLPRLGDALASLVDLARLLEPPARLDRYGMDPDFAQRAEPLLDLLYTRWWRVEVKHADRVPSAGPVMVVASHGGAVPWDALVLRRALFRDHPARRDLRPLLDDRECELSGFGPLAVRLGAVRAAPEPVERILGAGGVVGVFPEGSSVARRPWRDRYRIQHFGRGGFAKLALRAGAPIVPCAIVGSEEASPAIARAGWLADRLGLPAFSVRPVRVGPAALLPLPSRWSLTFGEPIPTDGLGPAAASDPVAVAALVERVRTTLQAMLDDEVGARSGVFL